MLNEDTWGNGRHPYVPGFWGIICLFNESTRTELNAIIGMKSIRLRMWTELLARLMKESGDPEMTTKLASVNGGLALAPALDPFSLQSRYDFDMWEEISDFREAKMRTIDLHRKDDIQGEIQRSNVTLKQIRKARKEIGEFITTRFDIKDLF
jgi:hypothetical protein